jgi:hypothetical protein
MSARSVSFPFSTSRVHPAKDTTVVGDACERRLYLEVVTAASGLELDRAVVDIYRNRPESDMPAARDSRRAFRRYGVIR